MKNSKIIIVPGAALLVVALSSVAVAQGKATARDVIAKVREAARTLSKTRDLTPFTRKPGPWVWKDTYVFVVDCDKKVIAAHPIKPGTRRPILRVVEGHQGKQRLPRRLVRCSEETVGHLGRLLVAEAWGEGRFPQAQLWLGR